MAKRWLAFRRGTINYSTTKDWIKDAWYQPQLGYLPAVNVLGSIPNITEQQPCRRYNYELRLAAKRENAVTAVSSADVGVPIVPASTFEDLETSTTMFISGPLRGKYADSLTSLSDTASEMSRDISAASLLELRPLEITEDDYYLDGRFSSSEDGTVNRGSDDDYTVEFFDKSSLAQLRRPQHVAAKAV